MLISCLIRHAVNGVKATGVVVASQCTTKCSSSRSSCQRRLSHLSPTHTVSRPLTITTIIIDTSMTPTADQRDRATTERPRRPPHSTTTDDAVTSLPPR